MSRTDSEVHLRFRNPQDIDRENAAEEAIPAYRILFPLGVVLGLMGVLFWFLFLARAMPFYPRMAHGGVMFFGWLWLFVAGFLMTSFPRMTQSNPASVGETAWAAILALAQLTAAVRNLADLQAAILMIQTFSLAAFLGRRYWQVRRLPFESFVFVPMGLVMAVVGCFLYWVRPDLRETSFFLLAGEALAVNAIVGLGSRLIPAISRLPSLMLFGDVDPRRRWQKALLMAIALNVSYLLSAFAYSLSGWILRSLLMMTLAVSAFGLFQKPMKWTTLGVALKTGVVFLVLGELLSLPSGGLGVAAHHVKYIGGLSLITWMVGTRVMLAHGQQKMDYESTSWVPWLGFIFLILAALSRLFAGSQIASLPMIIAAGAFIASWILWGWKFLSILRNLPKE